MTLNSNQPSRLRIAMLSPILGEAFGLERAMHSSGRILQSYGHEIHYLGAKQLGEQAPQNIHLVSELHGLSMLALPAKVNRAADRVMIVLGEIAPDIVHLHDLFHPTILERVASHYPVTFSGHLVSATCPASTRLIPAGGGCEVPSGWRCLGRDLSQHCLSHFSSVRAKLLATADLKLKQRALRDVRAIFAVSRYVKRMFEIDGWPSDRIHVLYNPVELSPMASGGGSHGTPLILCASRLEPYKGVGLLLTALKFIENLEWELVICGEGSERVRLQDRAKALNLEGRVSFKGRVEPQLLRKLMTTARLVVQPNLGPEPFGLSVAEASSAGVAVVATAMGALPEIVEHNVNGLVCEPTAESLATTIQNLVTDENLAKRLASRGPSLIAERFSDESHAQTLLTTYHSILGRSYSGRLPLPKMING